MLRSPLRPDVQQRQQQQQQQQQTVQQRPHNRRLSGPYQSPSRAPRLSGAAANKSHTETIPCAAASPSPAKACSSSSSSSGGLSITAIGREMLQLLEGDCQEAARGAKQRADEFAKFIDEQIAELEELATESAALQAEVEDLNAKTQQNLQEVEMLLEEDKAVDADLARVAAAKEKVELRFEAAQRKLQATRSEYTLVARQAEHACRAWRARVDLFKFTHGIRIQQLTGQSATRICFLGLYKELPELECFLDVSLESDSCRVVGAWPETPLSELADLYAEGRASFAALLAHARLLFKCQLTKMSHTEKLVSLHKQQRCRAEETKQLERQQMLLQKEKEALVWDV